LAVFAVNHRAGLSFLNNSTTLQKARKHLRKRQF